jgi:hypothetical protein
MSEDAIRYLNSLELTARQFKEIGRFGDALRIYYFMAEGDRSLDAGSLASKIGECHEAIGELNAAKFWFGRAVEENPGFEHFREQLSRVADVNVSDLLQPPQEADKER